MVAMKYPEHIYDTTRIMMAEQLIEKEFAKLLRGTDGIVRADLIQSWREKPNAFHLENGIRDFWDILAAIIESIKLKPGFTAFLTAENYHWVREEVAVESIQLSSYLDTLKSIPNLEWSSQVTVGGVMNFINTPELLERQKENSDQHSKASQDHYPIFIRRTTSGENRVMDGNRRSLRAALYGRPTIDAWVAYVEDDTTTPRNYWVPVNDLMQLVKLFVAASSEVQKQSVRNSLEILFTLSKVGRITFDERVLEMRGAKELIAMTPSV
jgi:hypothetical protein